MSGELSCQIFPVSAKLRMECFCLHCVCSRRDLFLTAHLTEYKGALPSASNSYAFAGGGGWEAAGDQWMKTSLVRAVKLAVVGKHDAFHGTDIAD